MSEEQVTEETTQVPEMTVDPHGRPVNLDYSRGRAQTDITSVTPPTPPEPEAAPEVEAQEPEKEKDPTEEPKAEAPSAPQTPANAHENQVLNGLDRAVEEAGLGDYLGKEIDLGEGQKTTIKEALETTKTIRQRYGALGRQEQVAQQREAQVAERELRIDENLRAVNKMQEQIKAAITSDDPDELLDEIATFAGVDPYAMWENMSQALIRKAERMAEMTEEEQTLLKQNRRQQIENKRLNREKAELETKNKGDSSKAKVQQLMTANNVTQQEFVAAAKEIDALASQGKLTPEYLDQIKNSNQEQRAQIVINQVQAHKLLNRIDNVIDSVNPELKGDDRLVKELVATAIAPRTYAVTDQDLLDIVRGYNPAGTVKAEAKPEPPAKEEPPKQEEVKEETDPLANVQRATLADLEGVL